MKKNSLDMFNEIVSVLVNYGYSPISEEHSDTWYFSPSFNSEIKGIEKTRKSILVSLITKLIVLPNDVDSKLKRKMDEYGEKYRFECKYRLEKS